MDERFGICLFWIFMFKMYNLKFELDKCKDFLKLKKFIDKNKIKLIFFGETHGLVDELSVQEEIIKRISPEFYLYELLEEEKILDKEDFKLFLEKPDGEDFSIISTFGELKPTIMLARKFNISLIGCDIKNMGRENADFRTKKNWSKEDLEKEETLFKKRELKQKEVIEEYLSKTQKVIFVSLGLHHIRKESFLMKNLKCNFLIIFPVVKKNQKLWEAKDFSPEDISYIITSKNKYLEDKNGKVKV